MKLLDNDIYSHNEINKIYYTVKRLVTGKSYTKVYERLCSKVNLAIYGPIKYIVIEEAERQTNK